MSLFVKKLKIVGLVNLIIFSIFSVAVHQFQRQIELSSIHPVLKAVMLYPSYFEDQFYDFRMNLERDRNYKSNDLVMAAIDEISLKKLGRFPWTRTRWNPILRNLKTWGAKVVAYDVIFSEPELSSNTPSPDELFVKEILNFQEGGNQTIIIPYSLVGKSQQYDELAYKEVPESLFNFIIDAEQKGNYNLEEKRVMSTTFPISKVTKASPALAYIGAREDNDGVFRRYPLVTNVDGLYFPSLSLLAYQLYTEIDYKLKIDMAGDGRLSFPFGDVRLNHEGETKLRWVGDLNAFPLIPLHEIHDGDPSDEKMKKIFNNKVVFIGSTAFGAHDLRNTPVDGQLPGVYFHMNATQMLIDKLLFAPASVANAWSWSLMLIGLFGMICISKYGSSGFNVGFMVIYSLGSIFLDYIYFLPTGIECALFFTLHGVIGAYLWITMIDFYQINQDKKFLKSAFGNYISPELIDMMYESGHSPTLGGESEILTAYFTDIQSFSSFSEKLTAKQLVELLNEYLTEMTDILMEESGTLDKYEGDAIIAFFGAPMPLPDHATRSCRVCLKMQESLLALRKKWVQEEGKWPEVVHNMRMRVGINSGEIVTGNMGSRDRMNYTMMGDSVNLAARLEESAKQYGIFNHVSQYTKDLTDGSFVMRELDTIKVVGKSEPVTTYDLLGEADLLDKNLSMLYERFHIALNHYKNKQWDQAISIFNECLEYEHKRYPNKIPSTSPSSVYIERCEKFKLNPPPEDWDGVYTLTHK